MGETGWLISLSCPTALFIDIRQIKKKLFLKDLSSENIPREKLINLVTEHYNQVLQVDSDEVIKEFLALPKDSYFDETSKRKTFKPN